MKKFLQDLIARKNNELANLKKRSDESQDINEVKEIGSQMDSVKEEIKEAEDKLNEIEADEEKEAEKETEEARSAFNPSNVLASAKMNEKRGDDKMEDSRATMEYRKAFMDYVQRGVKSDLLQYEKRDSDQSGTAANLGVLIPSTVIQSIMTGVEKVYGQLYSRVRKTNIKGGVKYPIGSFSATFNRISENGKSARQNAGGYTGEVTFAYKIGEIRIARSLLQTVLSVAAFEEKFAEVIVKAYVKAMDTEIMVGTEAANQCVGILTEAANATQSTSRFYGLTDHIIEFTAEEMADWKEWQKKLFAIIPISMRGLKPEFAMTANTYEANIKTLVDDNNRPVATETFNPVDGAEICRFAGKDVCLVEEDILANFNNADDGDYFGMYWVPEESYAINTNLEFIVREYFDEELNQYVKKALVINDGKILDPKYIYLLKKSIEG